jgi:hypothetical protein
MKASLKKKLEKEYQENCPDCGVEVGEEHLTCCDVERCSVCGGQLLSCDEHQDTHNSAETKWDGYWPGVRECYERGWFSRMVPGKGGVPCDGEYPEATADLNRLAYFQVYGEDGIYKEK